MKHYPKNAKWIKDEYNPDTLVRLIDVRDDYSFGYCYKKKENGKWFWVSGLESQGEVVIGIVHRKLMELNGIIDLL